MPTLASAPPSQGSARCTPLERLVNATARPEEPRITSSRATSSSPTWFGLGHASAVITRVPRCQSPPPKFASLLFTRARAPGFSKCPASRLITSWARHRRHQSLRIPPGLSWRLPGVGHTVAPLQRPPAHLTRRAVDSHSFAVLATDAHGYAAQQNSLGRGSCTCNLIRLGPQGQPCERPTIPGGGAARRQLALSAPCSIKPLFAPLSFASASLRRSPRPVASLHQPRVSRVVGHRSRRLVPSLPALASGRLSRGPAAPMPRAVRAPCFSLFFLSLPRPSSRRRPRQRPGSPAGNPRSALSTLNGCLQPALSRALLCPVRRITLRAADFASLRAARR